MTSAAAGSRHRLRRPHAAPRRRTRGRITRGLTAALLASLAPALQPSAQAQATTATLVYLCDAERTLSLVQPEPPKPGDAVELIFGPDRKRMEPARAASGARYLSKDGAWEWWSKGPGSQLADAAGNPLASNCALYMRVGPPSAISR